MSFVFSSIFIVLNQREELVASYIKGNILDLVLANTDCTIEDICINSEEPFPGMKLDHKMVSFTIPCLWEVKIDYLCVHNFSKGDYKHMNDY